MTTWTYDNANQLTVEQRSDSSAYHTTFTYDNVGNRETLVGGTDWTATGAGTTGFNGQYGDDGTYGGKTAYKLDATHYLVWVSGSTRWELQNQKGAGTCYYYGSGASLPANNWTTDQGSNPAPTLASTVTSVAQGTTTYTYNAGNRLTLITDPSSNLTTNTYDNNGNVTVTDDDGTVTTYTWTYDNRLRTVTLAGPATTTFTYDGDGLRRQTVTAAGTTNFIWDGQDVLLETDVSNNTQVTYTQTPAIYGNLVSQRRSTTTSFYHHDALGSTLALTDANENVTDTYRYYAFGETLTSTGTTVNNLRFVGNLGYYNEANLSLQYLRARYYQPSTGRFVSVDPEHDGVNWYVYAGAAPTVAVDPEGRLVWWVIGGGIVVVVGGVTYIICGRPRMRCRAGLVGGVRYCQRRLKEEYGVEAAWPQVPGAEAWLSDMLVHCVGHCYITGNWNIGMSEWCADWRNDDSDELAADRRGQRGAQRGYESHEDCFNWCVHHIPPLEDQTGTQWWPGGIRPPLPPRR